MRQHGRLHDVSLQCETLVPTMYASSQPRLTWNTKPINIRQWLDLIVLRLWDQGAVVRAL